MTLSKIIDRSEAQKAARVAALRAELFELGYSVVTTKWLASAMSLLPAVKHKPELEDA
jgi:hypothetical protein